MIENYKVRFPEFFVSFGNWDFEQQRQKGFHIAGQGISSFEKFLQS
jgi:hypothetical protein